MVEQLTLNQLVPGSSPGGATRSKPAIAQRFAGFVVYRQPTGKDGYEKGARHTLRRSPPARPPYLRQRYPHGFVWPDEDPRSAPAGSDPPRPNANQTPRQHHGCDHAHPTAPSATRLARECQLPPRRCLVLADTRSGRHSIQSLFPKTTGVPWSPSPTMIFKVMKPTPSADRYSRPVAQTRAVRYLETRAMPAVFSRRQATREQAEAGGAAVFLAAQARAEKRRDHG